MLTIFLTSGNTFKKGNMQKFNDLFKLLRKCTQTFQQSLIFLNVTVKNPSSLKRYCTQIVTEDNDTPKILVFV